MQYIEGLSLREVIEKEKIISEERAMKIILDVLDVLDYLTSIKPRAIIHGDVKPENIILTDERAVLIDFGSTEDDTGSSGFCAPERLVGIKKSISSDIYSVGEILHFLLSGKTKKVFDRNNSYNISSDIFRIIDKSTRKTPGERYEKPMSMTSEIKRVTDMRKSGILASDKPKSLCFPGNPEAAGEAALALSKQGKTVLLADLDMLSPGIDMVFGIRKYNYAMQDFLSEKTEGLKRKCIKYKKSNTLYLLPCRNDFEGYETAGEGIILKLLEGCSGFFDILVLSCCDFPYDRYLMDALFFCDDIIFPVEKGAYDIRRFNSLVKFITKRQGIPKDKISYMGYNYHKYNLTGNIAAGVSGSRWLGTIPYVRNRVEMNLEGSPYVNVMDVKVHKSYKRIMKKIGVV